MKMLLILLVSFSAIGQSSNPNDTLKIGNKGSSADKGIVFETNDGVSNKTLKVNPTNKSLIFSGNDLQIGDGATGNAKKIILDPSSGAALSWDGTKQKIQFDNGGGAKDLGSGSGGGGGDNYNNGFGADDNANAEDGLTGWTASAGTFALDSSDPIEGENSFTWIPAAQNDTLDGPVLSFDKDVFRGNACQAKIEYIGADENLTLQVIDANNDVLGSEVLKVHTVFSQESVFFLCPSQADITGDANKGNLRYRILNEGASASPIIKFDKSYLGTLVGLSETVLPDVLSVNIDGSNGAILEKKGEPLTSCSRQSAGTYVCVLNPLEFTVLPSISVGGHAVGGNTDVACYPFSYDIGNFNIRCARESDNSAQDTDFSMTFTKQGVDAKQTVQVYKAIPKISDNVNEFNANVSGGLNVTNETINFINNCTSNGTGDKTCTFVSGLFTSAPTVQISMFDGNGNCREARTSNITSTYIRYQTFNSQGNVNDCNVSIEAKKSMTDLTLGKTQNISLAGIAVNSYAESSQKQVRVESCHISNSGTPVTNSPLCDGWVSTLNDVSTGRTGFNFNSNVFSDTPVCQCTTNSNATLRGCNTLRSGTTALNVYTTIPSTGAFVDSDFNITCVGAK